MEPWPPPSAIQIEASWRLDTTHFRTWRAFRKWLIDGEAKVRRTHSGMRLVRSSMEHFAVVQSIIRAGLAGNQAEFKKQVLRLRERLEAGGKSKEVAALDRLRSSAQETEELTPSRVVVSRALVTGEVLGKEVNPPIDRETGARLCTIDLRPPSSLPVYDQMMQGTIEGLLEEWSKEDALRSVGVEPTRSLLIYGPPGSGKTVTAHYIANRLSLPLVTARIDGLISSFLGTTARNIANLFEFANRYACVLLLDEFDALAKLRDDPHEIGEIKRVVNTLLQNLDLRRRHGITIAITNHDRLLDPAVWRRFETQLHLGEPAANVRERLIARFLEPVETDDGIRKIYSYCLTGRSGADIERLCVAVKRTLALTGEDQDSAGLFRSLSTVMSRLPSHDHLPARILASDKEAFISLIANDQDFPMNQTEIGKATGYVQSRISDLKKAKRHLTLTETPHAQ